MRKLILATLISLNVFGELDTMGDYVKAENTFDTICLEENKSSEPYGMFHFSLLKKAGIKSELTDLKLGEFTSNFSYKVGISVYPYFGAPEKTYEGIIEGCERTIIMVDKDDVGDFLIYFECNDNGSTGFGEIKWQESTGKMFGYMVLPEGHYQLKKQLYSTVNFECLFVKDFN